MRFRRANLNWCRGGCGAGGSEGGRNTVGCNDSCFFLLRNACSVLLLSAALVMILGELFGAERAHLSTHPLQWELGTNEGGWQEGAPQIQVSDGTMQEHPSSL